MKFFKNMTYEKVGIAIIVLVLLVFSTLVIKVNDVDEAVYLNEVAVSKKSEVSGVVKTYLEKLQDKMFTIGDVKLKAKELGLTFDIQKTKRKLINKLKYSFIKGLTVNAASGDGNERVVEPVMSYDKEELAVKVAYIVNNFNQDSKDADLLWSEEEGWYVVPGQLGRKVADVDFVTRQILQELVRDAVDLRSEGEYKIKYLKDVPAFSTSEAWTLKEKLESTYLNKPVLIMSEGKEIARIDMSDSSEWFDFSFEEGHIYVNQAKLEYEIEKIAKNYEENLASVRLVGVEEFESEYDGEIYLKAQLDGDLQKANMVDRVSLKRDILLASGDKKVELKFHNRLISIESEVEGMEFPDLISYGKSDYSLGSYANRVHNIKTAVGFQDLTIIPKGETFSFNRVGGWVTYAKGYKAGEVIFGTEARYVAGGGVCQVSTTIYRAAVYAGLEIEQRRNHSWDVSYYRDVYGVDAAVYPPGGLDVKFKNNTPGPILVHTYVDEENQNVYFEFYGTSDGRSVTLSEPEITWLGGGAKKIVTLWEIMKSDGSVETQEIVSRYSR